MLTIRQTSARMCVALLTLFFISSAFAGSPKVEVCHIPPDDPDNYHTIKINEKALAAHLAHFDLVGACNQFCAELCDDGNACTIDDSDDCEQNGCPVVSEPVDCSDGNLCTDDLCDPVSGCFNPVAVTCNAPDLCTSSTCDPSVGVCEDTPVICDDGEQCNPDNGSCEPVNAATCPCYDLTELQAGGTVTQCGENFPDMPGFAGAMYSSGEIACSGASCTSGDSPSCAYSLVSAYIDGITNDEDNACQALILANCPNPN